jgi:uncharacterized protein
MKIVCIYHSIDLDGWMSAAIVKYWFETDKIEIQPNTFLHRTDKETLSFIGHNYGQPIPDLSEYDKVIMCDISFPKNDMVNLQYKLGNNFIWIDHHISAINDNLISLKEGIEVPIFNGLRDTKFAACELTWQYFMSNPIVKFGEIEEQNPMPEIVRLLGRYDCFGHKGTDEELKVLEFQYGARLCISNYEEAYNWLNDSINNKNKISPEQWIHVKGKRIYQYLCTEAKQAYKNGFEIVLSEPTYDVNLVGAGITKRKFICINKERFNPINFGIDYHKDGYDGCACFHYDGVRQVWAFSLYNDNGKVDCSQIAKQYGGGGHKGASGFILNDINNLELWKKKI